MGEKFYWLCKGPEGNHSIARTTQTTTDSRARGSSHRAWHDPEGEPPGTGRGDSRVNLSDLRPAYGSHKAEKRLGRGHGSGRGKTAGRGTKGQKARTGGKIHRAFNGGQTRLSKRLPFVRGLGNASPSLHDTYTVINIAELDDFKADSVVSPETLVTHGVVRKSDARGLIKI